MSAPLARRLLAEFLGSAFLAAVVIGSGIAAQQLSPGDTGLQLLYNAAATAEAADSRRIAGRPSFYPHEARRTGLFPAHAASSSPTSARTRRSMSSRVARTSSSGRSFGSGRSQSSRSCFLPGT